MMTARRFTAGRGRILAVVAALSLPAARAAGAGGRSLPSLSGQRAAATVVSPATMRASPGPVPAGGESDVAGVLCGRGGPTPRQVARVVLPALALSPLVLGSVPASAMVGLPIPEPALRTLLDSAFFQALSLIFVSEIGDKTFFIATLLAARTSRLLTFLGAAGALAVMTVFSVVIGQIFHAVPTGITGGLPVDDIVAVASFTYFGVKSLQEAASIPEGDTSGMDDEREEAEEELGKNPIGVCFGAILAHCIATGGAVLGGSFISKYLSEKVIGYIGGSLFIVFAATTFAGLAPRLVVLVGAMSS